MRRIQCFALATILSLTATLPLGSMADDGLLRAMGGTVVCGYHFDNVKDFSNWNVKNVNFDGDIRVEKIIFYDEFGALDYELTPIPPGHYGVVAGGVLAPQQSDVYRSQDFTSFSDWNTLAVLPKKGQVLIEWSATEAENLLPLGVNHVRTKKALTKQGKTVGLARTRNDCRKVSLQYAEK